MVQVTFDTNNDSLPELEEAFKILQSALERRRDQVPAAKPTPKMDMPAAVACAAVETPEAEESDSDTEIDAGFFKITVKSDEHKEEDAPAAEEHKAPPKAGAAPTLSQLLHDASLTEDELSRMFKEQMAEDAPKKPKASKPESDEGGTYLEIIEYSDEK